MMAEPARTSPLPPRSVIGILGSGQLGKMLAQAASRLGFRTHVYGDDAGPAFDVATAHSVGTFTSFGRLDEFDVGPGTRASDLDEHVATIEPKMLVLKRSAQMSCHHTNSPGSSLSA